jgi:hypothetical protein
VTLSVKNDVNVPSKIYKQKNGAVNTNFFKGVDVRKNIKRGPELFAVVLYSKIGFTLSLSLILSTTPVHP